MVVTTWYLRGNAGKHDFIDTVYEQKPSFFTLAIHHGGVFSQLPNRRYIGGIVSYFDCVDGDQFSVIELNAMLQELGYNVNTQMLYHFKAPDKDLDYGLYALSSDEDVISLVKYVDSFKLLEVYVEKGKKVRNQTPLKTYSPRKKMIRVQTPCQKSLFTDDAYVPIPVERENWDGSGQVNELGCNVESINDEFFNEAFFNDSTPNQTECGQGSGTGTGTGVHVVEVEEQRQGSDKGEDSDFVDNEHIINEVEVDMTDFRDNVDADVEWVACGDKPNESMVNDVEVERVNYDNIDSEPESGDDARTKALKQLRREHNTNPEKKVHFYPGQAFGTKLEVKELVTMLSIESRRLLKIVKNDAERFTVICEGSIPVFHADVGCSQQIKDLDKNVGPTDKTGPSEQVGPHGLNSPAQSPKGIRFTKQGIKDIVKEKYKEREKEKQQESQEKEAEKDKEEKVKCPWRLHLSRKKEDNTWVVKTYKDHHKCLTARVLNRCTSEFLAKEIQQQLHPDSKVQPSHFREQIQQKYEIGFSKHKIYRAHIKAKERLMGDYTSQYAILRDYILELKATNPGTTVRLDYEPEPNPDSNTRVFRRIYVCLGSLKQGFKAGGRDLLGLDGTFMKGLANGQLLLAVGIDPNNGTFPLAYGIVESENKASWRWFLEQLGGDLDLNHMSNFTFISDRQKGIIPAISELFPCAEHRYCLKHIYENMKLTYRGQIYKDFLWKCATATTVPEFTKCMEDLKAVNNSAYEWLKAIPPRHWARSHFSGRCHCDVLVNNMCETVNGKLVDGREKPIIMCLEYVREYLMKRHAKVQRMIDSAVGPLTPNATTMFELIKKEAERYRILFNGGTKFQVTGPWQDQHVVDIDERTCTCRKWELSGMPCKHAVATFNDMGNNGMKCGIPESYVHPVYWLATWRTMYSFTIGPTKGRAHWPKFDSPITILPPKHKVSIGRPKKKRRRSQVEIQLVKEGKLTRAAAYTKCGNCKQDGHNKRTCTRGPSQQAAGPSSTAAGSSHGRKKTAVKKPATKKKPVGAKAAGSSKTAN